jgi:hypothetical protein
MRGMASRLKVRGRFEDPSGVVYDLASPQGKVVLHFAREAAGWWRVNAHAANAERARDAVVVTAAGPTRARALAEITEFWRYQLTSLSLPAVDWPTVVALLDSMDAF